MSLTFKGNATVEGIAGTLDVIVWLLQTGRFADEFEEEIIKDQHGNDTAWIARNQKMLADLGMKVCGMNNATKASLLAQQFPLTPLTTVTLSAFTYSGLNGTYQYMPGADLNLNFDKVNEAGFKLRRYADPTQNALAATTPT